MSNSTINLSYNEFVAPHKDIHLCPPAESPYDDVFLTPSLPNFSSSITDHRDGEASASPDINMAPRPTLADVCEKVTLNSGHPYIGMTFTLSNSLELTSEEDNLSLPKSAMITPNEKHGVLQGTFVCEESSDHKQLACVESEPLTHYSGAFTPDKCVTVMPSQSIIQDIDNVNQTSTPVPNVAKQILPSLLESPCIESSSTIFPNEQQPASTTPPNHCAVGLHPFVRRIKKMESALTNVNSKVATRTVHKKIVSGSSPQHKRLQTIVLTKCPEHPRGTIIISPSKVRNGNVFVPVAAKRANRQASPTAARLGLTITHPSENTVGNGTCSSSKSNAAMKSSVVQCRKASTETEKNALSQVEHSPAQSKGSRTFCVLSLEKFPDKSFQKGQKPTANDTSNKTGVKLCPALRQVKTRPHCSSETLPSSLQPPKEKKTISKSSSSITSSRHEKQNKPATPNNSSQRKLSLQTEASKRPAASQSPWVLNKISLATESGRARAATLEKSRTQGPPSQNQPKGTYLSQPPNASHRPAIQSVGTPKSKQNMTAAGSPRNWGTRDPASAARVKPQLSVFRPPATLCPTFMSPPSTPTSRLPRKPSVPSSRLNRGSIHSDQNEGAANTQGSAVAAQTPVKTKARVIPTPGRWTGQILPTTNTPTSTNKEATTSTPGPLKRSTSSRFVGLTPSKPVEKNKLKNCSRQQVSTSKAKDNIGPPDVVPLNVQRDDRNVQRIQNLVGLLAASNCRFEAVTIVLQQALAERDEATGQCRELSQQLVNLRGELECSANSSERLEKEKQDLQDALECAMRRLQEQHQKDLEELEQRLRAFYQSEWDKVHLSYQEEAVKCKALLEKQMEQLEVSHDSMKLELEHSHVEQLQCVEQQHEQSLEELRKSYTQQLECLDVSLKDSEAALSAQIQMLTQENADLIEKFKAEENKRRELAESQKDSHTVYLEQELESLKVVLDIKNKQLHQQKKMMIEIDELLEKNVKLDESLKKVQQENEDLKARMERYAARSRQLSTEQAALQESLQKESNVNKRLSMENEELLWKLQNGEPSSPQKMSPSSLSPSHFSLQSPCSPAACPAFPLSPR
ncbi:microtubule-associated tumor suppressor 1 homolog A [Vanacampus margaritifer]